MTKLEFLNMLAQDLGATTKKAIADAVAPLERRIAELDAANREKELRIKTLELASLADGHRLKMLEESSNVQTH
jgi:hypothetical protein